MQDAVGQFTSLLKDAINSKNGFKSSQLLSNLPTTYIVALNSFTHKNIEDAFTRLHIPPLLCSMISFHIIALSCGLRMKYSDGYRMQVRALESACSLLDSDEGNWWLPVLDRMLLQLRLLAYASDHKPGSIVQRSDTIKDAIEQMRKVFRKMVRSSEVSVHSKCMGVLFVTVHLMKATFKINQPHQVKSLVPPNVSYKIPISWFHKAHQVAYYFYLGRYRLSEAKFDEALVSYEMALSLCPARFQKHRAIIFEFLVPLKLFMGYSPPISLLKRHNLPQYENLFSAIRNGNIEIYETCVSHFQKYFIQQGVFGIVEKLRKYVYRTIIRKVYLVHSRLADSASKNHYVRLPLLLSGIHVSGDPSMTPDELECIICNLISEGLIKGYVSHGGGLMLSKSNPFPAIQIKSTQ